MPIRFGQYFLCCTAAILLTALSSTAEDAPTDKSAVEQPPAKSDTLLEGHSYHGDVFNEGPRQQAYGIQGTGEVSFAVSSQTPGVQQFIEQGIGQLHGFWYFEAERTFRHAAMLDPECAIAYWGMAMANENNKDRAKKFIAQAVTRIESASPRETLYIYALNDWLTSDAKKKLRATDYLAAMTELTRQYPDDLEAQAFRGLAMYKHRSDLKLKYDDVEAALQAVLAKNRRHPVHHYRIHLWDYKQPENALDSARACGDSAQGIAHMWHMPGHIYSRLKRYSDAVWQQEASARVDHAQMMRDGLMPDQIHNFAHNNEWLIRNLTYLGRHRDAEALARNMISLPRHPTYNKLTDRHSAYYGRQRLFEVLYKYEQWRSLIEACEGPVLEPTDIEREQIRRLRYLGVARARCGENSWANVTISDLQSRIGALNGELTELDQAAEKRKKDKKKDKVAERKYKDRKSDLQKRIRQLDSSVADIRGQTAWFAGDYTEAVIELQKVSEGKDEILLAKARAHSGKSIKAIKDLEKRIGSRKNQVLPQVALVELLSQYGKPDKLRIEFDRLRDMSASMQTGSPPFQRASTVAANLGFRGDWRKPFQHAGDFGDRPNLASLGPFRWQPSPAPMWMLPNSYGFPVSSSSFSGRPVIVVFFLGHGCLHCAQQLGALMPRADEFRAAGIDLVAISSDDLAGLQKSVDSYGADINVDLLSDEKLTAFHEYRAFDDFEEMVLHGTFLIDADGLVRWQDISYEPFMDIDFLLNESRRLLAQEIEKSEVVTPSVAAPYGVAAVHVVKKVPGAAPSGTNAETNVIGVGDAPQHLPIDGHQLKRLGRGVLVLAGHDVPDNATKRFAQLARQDRSHVAVLRLPGEQNPAVTNRFVADLQGLDVASVAVVRLEKLGQTDERVLHALSGASGVWLAGDFSQIDNAQTRGAMDGSLQRVLRGGGVIGGSNAAACWIADRFLSADVSVSEDLHALAPRQNRLRIEFSGAAALIVEDAVAAASGDGVTLGGEVLRDGALYDLRAARRF